MHISNTFGIFCQIYETSKLNSFIYTVLALTVSLNLTFYNANFWLVYLLSDARFDWLLGNTVVQSKCWENIYQSCYKQTTFTFLWNVIGEICLCYGKIYWFSRVCYSEHIYSLTFTFNHFKSFHFKKSKKCIKTTVAFE